MGRKICSLCIVKGLLYRLRRGPDACVEWRASCVGVQEVLLFEPVVQCLSLEESLLSWFSERSAM